MKSQDIRQQFAAEGASMKTDLSQCSASFADWIAEKAPGLDAADLKLLMTLGGALHAAEAEQKWQRSWG